MRPAAREGSRFSTESPRLRSAPGRSIAWLLPSGRILTRESNGRLTPSHERCVWHRAHSGQNVSRPSRIQRRSRAGFSPASMSAREMTSSLGTWNRFRVISVDVPEVVPFRANARQACGEDHTELGDCGQVCAVEPSIGWPRKLHGRHRDFRSPDRLIPQKTFFLAPCKHLPEARARKSCLLPRSRFLKLRVGLPEQISG